MSESGFLELPGARLYWECEGEGPPLLLIHGGLGSLRMWDGQVPELARHYRVIRYDTRGFGRTETDDVEFANRADALAILDHLGAPSAYVIGQSRGGMIALDLALDHPKRVDALVHVASGIGGHMPDLPKGTPLPPEDELERLWNQRDWPAVAELETQIFVDGWGHPPTRVDPDQHPPRSHCFPHPSAHARGPGPPPPGEGLDHGRLAGRKARGEAAADVAARGRAARRAAGSHAGDGRPGG